MEKEFLPPKRTGIWVLLVLLLGVIAGILYVLSAASLAAQQTVFMANLLAAVVLIAVGIWLLLRMHTLFTTRYMLSRGGRLRPLVSSTSAFSQTSLGKFAASLALTTVKWILLT